MNHVILIEDLEQPALAIIEELEKQGCAVTWISGVVSTFGTVEECIFEAIEGGTFSVLELALGQFQLALVDYELEGSFTGAELVEKLRAAGVVCVGISASSAFNAQMLSAGACMSFPKHAVPSLIADRSLSVEEVVSTFCTPIFMDPQEVLKAFGF